MQRSREIYEKAIKSLDVANNVKYKPANGQTFCNFFVQDIMNLEQLKTPIPKGNCETILNCMSGNKYKPWTSVSFYDAQKRANDGIPTIGVTNDHIVVVTPTNKTVNFIRYVVVSQAGKTQFYGKTIDYSYKLANLKDVKFYSYYG